MDIATVTSSIDLWATKHCAKAWNPYQKMLANHSIDCLCESLVGTRMNIVMSHVTCKISRMNN